jgi:hypothetical protein
MKKILSTLFSCTLIYSCIQNNPQAESKPLLPILANQNDKTSSGQAIQDPFVKVTTYADGTKMNDDKCDGVLYKKIGNDYFKRSLTGPVQAEWYMPDGQGAAERHKGLKKFLNLPIADKNLNKKTYLVSGDLFADAIGVAGNSRIGGGTLKLSAAVTSSGKDGANILKIATSNNTFTDIVFDGNQSALDKEVPTRCVDVSGNNNTFNNCTFKGATINGVRIFGKGHRFNNCVFTENGGSGIEMAGASDIEFNNCYVSKNGGGFRKIKQNSTDLNHEFSGFGVAVRYRSSNIRFNNSAFYLNGRDGLNINQGSHDVSINNCKVYSNDDGGITVASDVVKSGQPGDGEDCYNIFIKNTSVSNNYSAGIAVYHAANNVQITGSKSFNNNRVAGYQTVQSSYYTGIYIAAGSNNLKIDKTSCYDDRPEYIVQQNRDGTVTIRNWTMGKLKERDNVSLYAKDGQFKGYYKITSETGSSVKLASMPHNSQPVNTIKPGDILSLKTQHNGVFIDNNCSGSCTVNGSGFRVGASGENFSGLLVFQGITASGNAGVAVGGKKISGNLITNPTFNSGISSWTSNVPEGAAVKDNAAARSGSSLKLTAGSKPVYSDAAYHANVSTTSKGLMLHFAAWVKADGNASLQLLVSPDKNTPYYYKMDTHKGDGKWQYLECWSFIPPNNQGIVCRLVAEPNTTANIDDVSLELVKP